jgi:hypothetical protein
MADSMASVSLTLVTADEQDRPIGALSVTAPGTRRRRCYGTTFSIHDSGLSPSLFRFRPDEAEDLPLTEAEDQDQDVRAVQVVPAKLRVFQEAGLCA